MTPTYCKTRAKTTKIIDARGVGTAEYFGSSIPMLKIADDVVLL